MTPPDPDRSTSTGDSPPGPALRESRLAMLLDSCGDALLAWDAAGRLVEVNRAAVAITGRSQSDLLGGVNVADLLGPLPELAEGQVERLHLHLQVAPSSPSASAERVPVAVTLGRAEPNSGVYAYALLRDESEQVAAQREAAAHLTRIHLLERELRTLLDNAPLVIYRIDPETRQLLYLNRRAEQLFEVPLDEALRAQDFMRFIHGEGRAAFEEALERACRGERPAPYEARLSVEGELVVQGTIYPLLGEDGTVTAVEGILLDISAEHEARTRLIQADRLFTLGMIAAGVAHEINNPAAFLTLGLNQLERLWNDTTRRGTQETSVDVGELIGHLQSSVERISLIARDLRLFANPNRPKRTERTYVDVNRTIEGALTLTRAQIMGQARLVVELEPVPAVLMNDARLAQVLVNLLVNAADAVGTAKFGERVITLRTRSTPEYVEISVANTGTPIPQELLERIWLPFFTTKGEEGTGLGLAISREIIVSSGGSIEVESPADHGTSAPEGARFVIRLPIGASLEHASANGPESTTHLRAAPRQRGLRVLVVDDEATLARAVAAEVSEHHEVTVAQDAERALELLSREQFDAVLCDLRMPGMSGEALFAEVRRRGNPHARAFVFMTGIGFGQDVERLLGDSGCPLLEKPFTTAQVLAAIEKVSARPRLPLAARK